MSDQSSSSNSSSAADSEKDRHRRRRRVKFRFPKGRRKTESGKAGFVSGVLENALSGETLEETEDEVKPIRKQSATERKASIWASEQVTADFFRRQSRTKSRSQTALFPTISSAEGTEETCREDPEPVKVESFKCEWKPGGLSTPEDQIHVRVNQSWVGEYVVGTDYWADKDPDADEVTNLVSFGLDQKQTWYNMPLGSASLESSYQEKKTSSVEQMRQLTVAENTYAEWRSRRLSTALQPAQSGSVEAWSDELRDAFQFQAKATASTSSCERISMACADIWLQNAGVLDRRTLTLVHTGFCFITAGGSKYRGLNFDQFTHYLQMIARAGSMPVADVIRCLIAYQRKGSGSADIDAD